MNEHEIEQLCLGKGQYYTGSRQETWRPRMKPDWEGFGRAIMDRWPLGFDLRDLAIRYGIIVEYDGGKWYLYNYDRMYEKRDTKIEGEQ